MGAWDGVVVGWASTNPNPKFILLAVLILM